MGSITRMAYSTRRLKNIGTDIGKHETEQSWPNSSSLVMM